MGLFARSVAAACIFLGILLWCRATLLQQQEIQSWRRIRNGPAAAALASDQLPPYQPYFAERAALRLNQTFPPDREGVREDLQRAIYRGPLASGLWVTYAENQLFSGRVAQGRAALQRSNDLDPRFPDQLLQSVQLWTLVGERDRAVATVKSIAALGSSYQVKSAAELSQMGVSPVEIVDMMSLREVSPGDAGKLLNAIHTQDKAQLRTVFAGLDDSFFSDPDFRLAALDRATDPIMFDVIQRIWTAESKTVQLSETTLIDNLDLQRPPFRSAFPLGWQQVPIKTTGGGGWVAPDGANGQRPSIRVAFPRVQWGQKGAVAIAYTMYRLPWSGEKGITIRARVHASKDDACMAWLSTTTRNRQLRSRSLKVSSQETNFEIYVPKSAESEILQVTISARSATEDPTVQTEIFVDGMTLEADQNKP